MGVPTSCCLVLVAMVIVCVLHRTQANVGTITVQGCTEAFINMQCPDNDQLETIDMRFSESDPDHLCHQQLPPQNVAVPREFWDTCQPGNDSTDGHMCMYAEEICLGLNNCTFYVSPHLIMGKEKPGVNSEIIITYKCKPGSKRKGEIAVAALVATVGILSMLTIGGLLMWRLLTQDPSTYADFSNDRPPRSSTPSSSTATSAANYVSSTSVGATGSSSPPQPSVSTFEEISVELRTPSGGASGARDNGGDVF